MFLTRRLQDLGRTSWRNQSTIWPISTRQQQGSRALISTDGRTDRNCVVRRGHSVVLHYLGHRE
jgi:hypothetical protein